MRTRVGSGDHPARFTDTVGVLTAWEHGVLTLTRRDGRVARLAEAEMVAAKVVPPAPARRRGVPVAGVAELTAVAARSWPAPDTERHGGWLARAAAGWTRRGNSAVRVADGPPDLDRLTAWYAARGLPPRVQIATGAAGTDEVLDAELAHRGWHAEGSAVLLVAPLAGLAAAADAPVAVAVTVTRELTEEWLRGNTVARQRPDVARRVLTGGPSVWFASGPGVVGRCVVDGRWAGFAAIEVAPERRRTGLGTAVMAALARVAMAEGASAAHLAVETDNAPARALYHGLGFAAHHHYHYRRAPDGR